MDKSWILLPRNSLAYQEGVKGFLDFAFERSSVDGAILCPCGLCNFRKWLTRDVVYEHLIIKQFPRNYTFWFDHGETHEVETENNCTANVSSLGPNIVNDEDPIRNMVNEAFGVDMHRDNDSNEGVDQDDEGAITVHSLLCDDLKFDLPGGRKIVVQWDELGRPVGNGAGVLGVFLGVLASSASKLPITYERWPKVAAIHKNQVWATIKEKFQVNEDGHKKVIMESLGKKWRDNRSRMFVECYDDKQTWETNLQERPEGVPLDQWVSYLHYKLSDKGKSYSEKNTANRRKQKIPHTLGSKSIARKQYELESQTGRPYSRLEMYTIAHKKKDGSFVNEEARQQIEQLEMEVDNNASEEDAFRTVIGKEHHGYVRGMGFGVCPSKVFKGSGSTSTNGSSAQVNKLQSELETERARVDALVQEVERFKGLEEKLAFVMQQLAGQGFNRVTDLGSPNEPRPSSSASHNPGNNGPSS